MFFTRSVKTTVQSSNYPIITDAQPDTIAPPWLVESPRRAAGMLPIITVDEPMAMGSGGPLHVHMSPTRAAGMKPIDTVGHPTATGPPTWGAGPGLTTGQQCISPRRAAGGITYPLTRQGFDGRWDRNRPEVT